MEIVYLLFHLANPKKVYFQMHVAGDKVFGHNYVFLGHALSKHLLH